MCVCMFGSDNTSSVSWYSPSRRQIIRQSESSLASRYEDYDYACSYGDRLPAPSPVYSRQGYVRSSLGNQCDWYARGDGDGHFEPDRYQDNLQAPDGRSPYRQYDESVNRSRDLSYDSPHCDRPGGSGNSDDEDSANRSRDPLNCYEFFEDQKYDLDQYDAQRKMRGYDEDDHFVNLSRDPLGCYYDNDGRYLDGATFSYVGTTASRLPDGQTRRNGGIGFDWTSAAPDRKSSNRKSPEPNLKSERQQSPDRSSPGHKFVDRKSPNRKSPDRKSAYGDDSVLIIGESGEFYSGDDRPPFDYNTGTVQRRAVKTSTSPYPTEPRSVDGMERRLPVKLALNDTEFAKPTATSDTKLVPDCPKLDKPEVMSEQKLVSDVVERRLPVGTESVSESPYRKEKDRVQRDSPYRGQTPTVAATGKNGTQSRSRAKVDDIQRLTERDRGPTAQNRKQQNHVTPRGERLPTTAVEESAKQSRSRGHKTTTTPVSTTSGWFISISCLTLF